MTTTYTECRACDGEGGAEGNVLTFERETGYPICEWIVCDACDGRGEVRVSEVTNLYPVNGAK